MASNEGNPVSIAATTRAGWANDPPDQGPTWLTLRLSPEMNSIVEELARRSDETRANIFNKAIVLYKKASDAASEGKRIGIADANQELETEFVGF